MNKVTIYTKPGCPFCEGVKEDLEKRGIPYTEYNIRLNPEALSQMLEINGGRRHVPTIVQGNQVTVGFQGYTAA